MFLGLKYILQFLPRHRVEALKEGRRSTLRKIQIIKGQVFGFVHKIR